MGCNFVTMTVDGGKDKAAVTKAFDKAVDQSRYEDGHSYSGEIGMAQGLRFECTGHVFYSDESAHEWLDRTAEKWGDALCVRFKDKNGNEQWMIGANCAS